MNELPPRTSRPLLLAGAVTLALGAANADAQGRIDRSFEPAPNSCADVRWSQSVLDDFPSITDSCRGVEWRDGKSYVKLEATVEENIDAGSKLRVDFENGGELTLAPSSGTALYVEGEKTTFADLTEGQELSFYIPEDRFQAEFPGPGRSAPLAIVPILALSSGVSAASTPAGSASGENSTVGDSSAGGSVGTFLLIPITQSTVANEAKSDGCWATLYGDANFGGDSLTLIGPLEMERMIGPFGFDWDDKLNSIKAGPRATVTLYDEESYADRSARIEPGKSVPEISEQMGVLEDVESMQVRCG